MPAKSEGGPASQTLQVLGLAFAGADLVFEIDSKGAVVFALGAVKNLTGLTEAEVMKKRWTELMAPADGAFLVTLLHDLQPGARSGPHQVTLAGGRGAARRAANISMFRLPQNGERTSCALSLSASTLSARTPRDKKGLVPKAAFEQAAADSVKQAQSEGMDTRLEMVEVPGLTDAVGKMDTDVAEQTLAVLASMLRAASYGGVGAAEVGTDRFALVSTKPVCADRLSQQLTQASGQPLQATAVGVAITPDGVEAQLKTIRYVLDRYIQEGQAASKDFMAMVEGAARASASFRTTVSAGAFRLAYQPIVSLEGDRLHHFEALARFNDESGPQETIRMAEEFGLILDFDLSVVRQVAKALAAMKPDVKIAANISGVSLLAPGFLEAMRKIMTDSRVPAGRLLLEITETARLTDMDEARNRIATLRKAGHAVCLDDFGAGSASMEYLAAFEFDFIKIDGAYVRALKPGSREAFLVKHVAALCKDLGGVSIAEMVETRETAQQLKVLGVGLGQGWAFGKPEPQPVWTPPVVERAPVAPALRRRGAVETWG